MAKHIQPRRPFKSKLKEEHRKLVFESSQDDLNKFDRIIAGTGTGRPFSNTN
ncbi:MAG: hypothetical protein U5L96_18400 [Owenweeksia sp.]|nr:hypothetical protein [Owenweeksia sp.]